MSFDTLLNSWKLDTLVSAELTRIQYTSNCVVITRGSLNPLDLWNTFRTRMRPLGGFSHEYWTKVFNWKYTAFIIKNQRLI